MAISRYSSGINLPNLCDALEGKQLAYKRVARMMHEKMKTRTLKARAAFQLPSIAIESGYAWQIATRYVPSVVTTDAKDCSYHMPNSLVRGEDVPNTVDVNLRKLRLGQVNVKHKWYGSLIAHLLINNLK